MFLFVTNDCFSYIAVLFLAYSWCVIPCCWQLSHLGKFYLPCMIPTPNPHLCKIILFYQLQLCYWRLWWWCWFLWLQIWSSKDGCIAPFSRGVGLLSHMCPPAEAEGDALGFSPIYGKDANKTMPSSCLFARVTIISISMGAV